VETEKLSEGVKLLNQHFDLAGKEALPVKLNTIELKQRLRTIISHLLDNDMEKLLQIMYRIDVSESAFRKVLSTSPPDQLPGDVADLVLEREWIKAETRLKYRQ
jgi:hypothetical protein